MDSWTYVSSLAGLQSFISPPDSFLLWKESPCWEYLCVLLHQLGEVVEEAVLGAKEIKLVVPLLLLHELGEELPPVPGHKLRRELHHVQVEGRDGRRVRDELELGRRLLRNHRLLDHLGLHLQGEWRQLSDFLQRTVTKHSGEPFFPPAAAGKQCQLPSWQAQG